MKLIIIFFIAFVSQTISAQVTVSTYDITTKNKLAYIKNTGELLTGIAESRKKNGHLIFTEAYTNGYKTKYTEYFNTDEQIIVSEIYYYDNKFIEKLKIKYSLDPKDRRVIHYDNNGEKTLEETYINDIIVYTCEYNNGKKHGKEFCTTKKCADNTAYYEHGKKIKI